MRNIDPQLTQKHGLTSKLYVIGPLPIAVSLSESGPWSYGVSQAALDNVAFIDTATLQYGALPKVGLQIPTEEAAAMDAASQHDEVPVASAFYDGSRRWPKLDIMSRDYKRTYALTEISAIFEDLGLNGLRTPRVKHRGSAWGLVIQHPSGWKLVYSGDTTPCDSLIEAGNHATLLIHEATLEDDKPDVALEKGHSTFSQAIEVGIRMDAKRILLNHFSQRYPKLPKSKVTATSDSDPDVSISYDLMSIKVGEMWRMKHYMDAAELLFKEDDDGDVEDAVKHDVNATVEENGINGGGKKKGAGKISREQKKSQKGKPQGAQAGAKRSASPTVAGGVKKPRSDEGEPAS
jgi:ribonuclease Z